MVSICEIIRSVFSSDIATNAIGSFVGGFAVVLVTLGPNGFTTLRSKFQKPSIKIKRRDTPVNIFTGIELGAPSDFVSEHLGPPVRVGDKWWGYRFTDSLVSIKFNENNSVQSLSVAITDKNSRFEFPAWHFVCRPLGSMTLKDVLSVDHLSIDFSKSKRHVGLRIVGCEGLNGAQHYIGFGSLSPNAPGPLLEPEFEWDEEKGALVSDPDDVLINWAALSSTDDIDSFPWDFGIKT